MPQEPTAPNIAAINKKTFVTDTEAEAITPFSRSWYQRARTTGGGPPFFYRGNKVYYDREELIAWLTRHRVSSTSEYPEAVRQRYAERAQNGLQALHGKLPQE